MVVNSCVLVSAGQIVKDPRGNDVMLLPSKTITTTGTLPAQWAPPPQITLSPKVDPVAYWNERHTFEQLEKLYDELVADYPTFVKKYTVGTSWRERNLWCLEITAPNGKEGKTPVAIVANIHGGEQESAECAAYTAWWFLAHYATEKDAKQALDNYVIYFVPVINPDGHAQSTLTGISTRQNQRPIDRDGNGTPFDDPYRDLDGDGFIGQFYEGANGTDIPDTRTATYIGMEAPDRNARDGADGTKTGTDPEHSDIDMNRTFDHMYHRFDVEAYNIGANTWTSAGPDAASEPEVRYIQNFLAHIKPAALITGHTGIQCVLWPWCWTPEPPQDGGWHERVGTVMAQAYSNTTAPVRGDNCTYYAMQSNSDYPTSSELIDWAWARLGTHAYTIEVYASGTGVDRWQNTLPLPTWRYVGRVTARASGSRLLGNNVWIYTSGSNQVSGRIAPPDQSVMCEGFKNAALVMLYSERPAETFTAMPPSPTMRKGETLVAKTSFTEAESMIREIDWVSSNPKIATVDANGVVTGLSAGSVVITGTTVDGGIAAMFAIRVM